MAYFEYMTDFLCFFWLFGLDGILLSELEIEGSLGRAGGGGAGVGAGESCCTSTMCLWRHG